ncbi:antibiotic biosynthesis monooxygenase [Pseudomonadales bacterium]|jgi:quinol monooxygenase YgiN|nr:antibiotic biosynthesis monooxygenase [Gammaproteobacteria bacterium]MDA7727248.1 antibiotic biosynthesis monooxygenase [Pseudomonadales bacterium]MBT3737200.1 antibiotic biosynthesis monooxygenase [Gammaproteobacteria bacterium]MBT3897860.1 antibiotic biosynthesis monooxygenase [Gammaproteobacteria bacterium]MBT7541938.1 antibiotic biosynthesis monooxygenase [Gammaproteobacteria bacterium]|tara:strand:- start:4221 stop:4613 length:393 start_codon:yes stop_codon:yes gene_type:complete
MIIVHGTFPVKADYREEALALMKRMSVASRAEEGCISYEFYVGLSDINTLLLFQEWDCVDSLQAHFETEHMEEFLKVLPDILDGEVTTRRYEVRGTGEGYEEGELASDNLIESDLPDRRTKVESRPKIIH